MRHTLFKILVCACLLLLFLATAVVSLPSIVANQIFHTDPDSVDPAAPTEITAVYDDLAAAISDCVNAGYEAALAEVTRLIIESKFDPDLCNKAVIDFGKTGADYDTAYVLAAYSASMEQRGAKKLDMDDKLNALQAEMFPVTSEVKTSEKPLPLSYAIYKKESVTVVSGKVRTGSINGVAQYRYTTAQRTYYLPNGTAVTNESLTREAYKAVSVELPIYSGNRVVGTRRAQYFEQSGTETLTPQTQQVQYLECTIHPFDQAVILKAFGVDPAQPYSQFGVTTGEAIDHMCFC
jgi:hypothetical protein